MWHVRLFKVRRITPQLYFQQGCKERGGNEDENQGGRMGWSAIAGPWGTRIDVLYSG
jgi:hypothetical protein